MAQSTVKVFGNINLTSDTENDKPCYIEANSTNPDEQRP